MIWGDYEPGIYLVSSGSWQSHKKNSDPFDPRCYLFQGIEWTNIEYFNNAIICDLIENVSASQCLLFLILEKQTKQLSRNPRFTRVSHIAMADSHWGRDMVFLTLAVMLGMTWVNRCQGAVFMPQIKINITTKSIKCQCLTFGHSLSHLKGVIQKLNIHHLKMCAISSKMIDSIMIHLIME